MTDDVLQLVWKRYRTWATTSSAAKEPLVQCRKYVLLLTVAGAILGTLSEQTRGWELMFIVEKAPAASAGFLSAIALALATYLTRSRLGGEEEKRWVRAPAGTVIGEGDVWK